MTIWLTEEWNQEIKTSGGKKDFRKGKRVCHQLLSPLWLRVFSVTSTGVTDRQLAHSGPCRGDETHSVDNSDMRKRPRGGQKSFGPIG